MPVIEIFAGTVDNVPWGVVGVAEDVLPRTKLVSIGVAGGLTNIGTIWWDLALGKGGGVVFAKRR